MINGNGKKSIKILHWNMGGKLWQNKTDEVRHTITEQNPDIFIIPEANLYTEIPLEQKAIEGYYIVEPLTRGPYKHSRMIVLVRDSFQLKVREDLMDPEILSMWMEVTRKGRKKLLISAIYREHSILRLPPPNLSNNLQLQTSRWKKLVKQWKDVSKDNEVYVIGDTNLDYLKWDNPPHHIKKIIDEVKNEIETVGFQQVIEGVTRSWNGQQDSCIDPNLDQHPRYNYKHF